MPPNEKFKILIVCTGNTCRSPMAEGIAKKIAAERNVGNLEITSAGIGTIDGLPATDYAIEAARHWDIDISQHRSTSLTVKLAQGADLILAMAPEHVERIISIDKQFRDKTYLVKSFPLPYDRSQARVDDPIGGSLEQYNQTFLELDEIFRKIFPKIIEMTVAKKS
jgi:protein-tyrosine-phosphatase